MSLLKLSLNGQNVQPRVGQLDASVLDSELLELLKKQLWSGFKSFRPDLKDSYESELLLVLKLLLFKLTVWDHSATYGGKLQNVKFVDARAGGLSLRSPSHVQKIGYGILVVGGGYIWSKLEAYLTHSSYQNPQSSTTMKLRDFMDSLSTVWSVSSLANFIMFLYSGRYSTLIMRLLRIRLVPSSRSLTRQVSFEFQNRQLVWNAFTEFLLFILPLLNIPRLRRRISRLLVSDKSSSSSKGELSFLPIKTCAICYQGNDQVSGGSTAPTTTFTDVTNPYQANECDHIYCYVCIANKILESEGDGWPCLRCGNLIHSARPYRDIDPRAIKVNHTVYKEIERPHDIENQQEPKSVLEEVADVSKEKTKETEKLSDSEKDPFDGDFDDDEEEGMEELEDEDDGGFIVDDEF